MKGQGAQEYLSVYGLSLLIITVLGVALYSLGVINPASYYRETCIGFNYFSYKSHQLSPGGMMDLSLMNGNKRVEVYGLRIEDESTQEEVSFSPVRMDPGERKVLKVSTDILGEYNQPYGYDVALLYRSVGGLNYEDFAKCTGKYKGLLFYDTFDTYEEGALPDPWTEISGNWFIEDNALAGTEPPSSPWVDVGVVSGNPEWDDYQLKVKMKSVSGNTRAPGPIVRYLDHDNYWWIECYRDKVIFRPKIDGDDKSWVRTWSVSNFPQVGTWHDLKVLVQGQHLDVYVDGIQYVDYDVPSQYQIAKGNIGLAQHRGSNEKVLFDELYVETMD